MASRWNGQAGCFAPLYHPLGWYGTTTMLVPVNGLARLTFADDIFVLCAVCVRVPLPRHD